LPELEMELDLDGVNERMEADQKNFDLMPSQWNDSDTVSTSSSNLSLGRKKNVSFCDGTC